VAGVVPVVEDGLAFQLRCGRQQDELALHVVDEVITAPFVKPGRAQCLDDQALDLGRRPAPCLLGIDGFDDLVGSIDLFGQAAAQHILGPRTGEFDEIGHPVHLGLQAGFQLLGGSQFDTGEGGALLTQTLPGKKAAERQGQNQHGQQSANQMNTRDRLFVSRQPHSPAPLYQIHQI